MENLPLWAQISILVFLLIFSGFFSIAETSLMALNRYRLKHLVKQGSRAAKVTAGLLEQTDRLLGTVLLGNNLLNTAATTLITALTIAIYGNDEIALTIATAVIAFAIIVFSEITPKVIGARFPEKIALPASYLLVPILKLLYPAFWFVNLFVGRLLQLLRLKPAQETQQSLSMEELRTVVLESSAFIPKKHHSILVNLFELEQIAVDDVMTPRAQIEGLNIGANTHEGMQSVRDQLATCYHNKLPVFEEDIHNTIGILHVRRLLGQLADPDFDLTGLRELLSDPYYIPSGTPLFQQLQYFQENKQRLGLVVDEYGEVLGLITLEDILEQIIGEFTTSMPTSQHAETMWDSTDSVIVEGSIPLRELNRRLHLNLALNGPKTLNGLILEWLQEIPEHGVSFKLGDHVIEILQVQQNAVKTARIAKLKARHLAN
ncbi:HlyC/CorC family transporter [Parvibium lacunae]|uniref:HlyC/CorC family transporter n=1 Tax=Parvibium lacunae TaxID=1888893 RepID=A0A368L1U7_9BURK|nr:HlyC/CorC family transporter [Parvibium lacunae]RCS57537.1 HlyC/CorC family transporter [Parvibium lacunae]